MATVKRFEELVIWQLARLQCAEVERYLNMPSFKKSQILCDQLDRSSGSVMDNIAEGFDRFTKADFRHFLVIVRGSNAEVRSQCYRAMDRNLAEKKDIDLFIKANINLSVRITNMMNHLSRTGYKSKPIPTDPNTNNSSNNDPISQVFESEEQYNKSAAINYGPNVYELPDEEVI